MNTQFNSPSFDDVVDYMMSVDTRDPAEQQVISDMMEDIHED